MRIVSLLPSATETLYALGAGDDLVGVTFECDYPPWARTHRVVSTSALPHGLGPAEIDAAVTRLLQAGADLYHLDRDAMSDLDAELVITQDLCAVCAVDLSTVSDALGYLGCTAEVLTTDPHTLREVWDCIAQIGAATGRSRAAERLVASLVERMATVDQRVRGLSRPRVAILEWTDPPFAPGHWVPEMAQAAGGHNVIGRGGVDSVRTTWDAVRAATPDILISAPCGYALEQSVALARELVLADPLGPDIPVWAVDANASFARPGPRLVDGIEALAAILHPDCGLPAKPLLAQRVR